MYLEIFLLILANLFAQSQGQADFTCVKDGLFAYNACTQYVQCVYTNTPNALKVFQNCPSGTLFDNSIQVCNWANQVVCNSINSQTSKKIITKNASTTSKKATTPKIQTTTRRSSSQVTTSVRPIVTTVKRTTSPKPIVTTVKQTTSPKPIVTTGKLREHLFIQIRLSY